MRQKIVGLRKKNYNNWVWKRAVKSIETAKENVWNRIENP